MSTDNTTRHSAVDVRVLAIVDAAAFVLSFVVAVLLRFGAPAPPEHVLLYLWLWPVLLVWRFFCAGLLDLYNFRRRLTLSDFAFNAFGAAFLAVAGGYFLLATVQLYYLPEARLSRLVAVIDLGLLAVWFTVSRWTVLRLLRARGHRVRLVVLGRDRELVQEMRAHAPRMLSVVDGGDADASHAEQLSSAIAGGPVDQIVLADTALPQSELNALLARCDETGAEVYLLPGIDLSILVGDRIASIAGVPLIPLHPSFLASVYRPVKRAVDIVAAALLLLLGLPPAAVVAALIKWDSPGPVLFRQRRVGANQTMFEVVKFRTMVADAEAETGPVLSPTGDQRVTKIGRLLRKYRIDEWPQLWNVLVGEMSLVGPRPERPEFVQQFLKENPLYERRFLVKPGLTGLAQIHGRYDSDYAHKLRYDLVYISSVSPLTDAQILLSTVRTVLTGYGAQ